MPHIAADIKKNKLKSEKSSESLELGLGKACMIRKKETKPYL